MAGFFKAGTLRDHRTKSKAIEVSMDLETHVLSLIIRYRSIDTEWTDWVLPILPSSIA